MTLYQYNSLLNLLSILSYLWTNVILNFVTRLPLNNDYNIILIMINWLIKKRYYIPCTIDKNTIIAEAITYLLFNNI